MARTATTDIPTVTEAITPDPATTVIDGVLDNRTPPGGVDVVPEPDDGPATGWFDTVGDTPIGDSVAGPGSAAEVRVELDRIEQAWIVAITRSDGDGIGLVARGMAHAVAWNDGTMIRVERHAQSGVWRITPVHIPDGVTCVVQQVTETGDDTPSDVARITWTIAPTHVALTVADAPW